MDNARQPPTAVLVLAQLVGLEVLRARVPAALGRTVDQLHRLLEDLAAELGGERVRSPAIGVLTRWPDADGAVRFAMELQTRALAADWPTTLLLRPEAGEVRSASGRLLHRGPRIRVAVHRGVIDVTLAANNVPVVGGPALYQVARVLSTAQGGQVLVTQACWSALKEPPKGCVHQPLGAHALIGVKGGTVLHQVLPEALSERTFEPVQTPENLRSNAPALRGALIGRDGDLQALRELEGFGVRVVTVTGPAGVGKSALLERYVGMGGDGFVERGAGGAWLCRVEGSEMAHLIGAMASTLGLSLRFGRSVDELLRQVGAVLRRRGAILLVLDAVQVRPSELREAVATLIKTAPELRFVVGSSVRLGVPGEITYELAPLPFAGHEGARNEDAVRLFIEKSLLRDPTFEPSDPALIASITNLLHGSPVAITFAAGLTADMSLQRLASELDQRDGSPDSVVELVWSSLGDAERLVLSSCGVYAAGFDRIGVEAVVDGAEVGFDPSEVLFRLRRAGLVSRTEDPRTPEVRRFRVQPRIRRRALGELEPSRRRALGRRAAARILQLCEPWADQAWGPDGAEVLARLSVEWVNLAGVAAAAAHPDSSAEDVDLGLRAIAALWPLVATQGPGGLFVDLATDVLARADLVLDCDPVWQVRALAARAAARRNVGDVTGALADAERGAAGAVRWGDPKGEGFNCMIGGLSQHARGRLDEASNWLSRGLDAMERAGEPGHAAVLRGALGVTRMDQGRLEEAEQDLSAARDVCNELGWQRHLGAQLTWLGLLHSRAGKLADARVVFTEASDIHQRTGDQRALAICLMNRGSLELREGTPDEAESTLRVALQAAMETGDRRAESSVHSHLGLAALSRGDSIKSREHLLAALAIDRDLRDRVSEALDMAHLGIAAHVGNQIQSAVGNYRMALRVLDEKAPARSRAWVHAWLGLALVEEHDDEPARAAFETARALAEQSGEPSVMAIVELLCASEALLVGDRGPVMGAYEARSDDLDAETVIARARIAWVLEYGLTTE